MQVDEPTVEDTISILRGLKERYEIYHGVRIHDNALVAAATLSNRYITDRFLPDKAIDLVDEACAMIRTEIDSMPSELDDLRRRIMQMEIEEMALKKEDDQLSRDRLEKLTQELAELKDRFNEQKARWEAEKNSVEEVKSLKADIDRLHAEGYEVLAVEQVEGAVMLDAFRAAPGVKYALVFGNEVMGVGQAAVDRCDGAIEIPQAGTKHSINVAVSGGVVLWSFFCRIGPGR